MILRGFVIAFGVLLLAGGLIGACTGLGPAMTGPILFGALLLAGTIFERRTYRKLDDLPPGGADWQATGEIFRDSTAGANVEVWYNKSTGARRYVKIGN